MVKLRSTLSQYQSFIFNKPRVYCHKCICASNTNTFVLLANNTHITIVELLKYLQIEVDQTANGTLHTLQTTFLKLGKVLL